MRQTNDINRLWIDSLRCCIRSAVGIYQMLCWCPIIIDTTWQMQLATQNTRACKCTFRKYRDSKSKSKRDGERVKDSTCVSFPLLNPNKCTHFPCTVDDWLAAGATNMPCVGSRFNITKIQHTFHIIIVNINSNLETVPRYGYRIVWYYRAKKANISRLNDISSICPGTI